MNYNPHDGEQKPEAHEDGACGQCLICKLNAVLMEHFPGDNDKPIPDHELAEMREALAVISGTMLLGANKKQEQGFVTTMIATKAKAEFTARMGELYERTGIAIIIA